jgi:predicted TIM-barrel fold metal-dependent hydrolase
LYRQLLDAVGYQKIIWGTDYPLRVMPKNQKKPDFVSFKNLLHNKAKLTSNESSAIFGGNILAILP